MTPRPISDDDEKTMSFEPAKLDFVPSHMLSELPYFLSWMSRPLPWAMIGELVLWLMYPQGCQ